MADLFIVGLTSFLSCFLTYAIPTGRVRGTTGRLGFVSPCSMMFCPPVNLFCASFFVLKSYWHPKLCVPFATSRESIGEENGVFAVCPDLDYISVTGEALPIMRTLEVRRESHSCSSAVLSDPFLMVVAKTAYWLPAGLSQTTHAFHSLQRPACADRALAKLLLVMWSWGKL